MRISERVHGFIQPVKTSFETAVTKASETVKKASEIASKILKVLFTPVTYLFNRAKSFYDKMRNQPASSDAPAPAPAAVESVAAELPPAFAGDVASGQAPADAANDGDFEVGQKRSFPG